MNSRHPIALEPLETRQLLSASIGVHDGTLVVRGTRRADHIVVNELPPQPFRDPTLPDSLYVTINGRTRRLDAAGIRNVRVEAGTGDDWVQMSMDPFFDTFRLAVVTHQQTRPATILGGDGDDTLIGGEAADHVSGGFGCDLLNGMGGNDTVDGDGNSDTVCGHVGDDLLRGGNGDDQFIAQSSLRTPGADPNHPGDRIQGGRGHDRVAVAPSSRIAQRSGVEEVYDDPTGGRSLFVDPDDESLFLAVPPYLIPPIPVVTI